MDVFISGLQNQDLKISEEHLENVRRFTMTRQTEKKTNRDNIPFLRFIDIWWIAMCVGIQEGYRTQIDPKQWHTFARAGEVLPSNPWRIFQLQLLAVGATGNTDILSKPGDLITMANEYAATGLPILIDRVLGSEIPIWAITDLLKERVNDRSN